MLGNTKLLLLIHCDGVGEIGVMLFKGTDLQLEDMNKSWRSNIQHSEWSQQYYSKYFKVAKRLDPKCSHYRIGNSLVPKGQRKKRNDNYVI